VPKENECTNLLVPVCLSASHIAYGSIRMEPVFMVLAQSAAVAASLAIDKKTTLLKVNILQLQNILSSNPLADGSSGDIFIDNEKTENVAVSGGWKKVSDARNSYGASWLQTEGSGPERKGVRFIPAIPAAAKYHVYTYVPRMTGGASALVFNISDGKTSKETVLDQKSVVVQGQASGEWVSLGVYDFPAGRKGFVELTNKGADGLVVADAVLLVPEKWK
jgi:hypothetical protein